ncbi:hypothetical protein BKH43_06955 [Helicobacter sp. 13S00401-1]|uniref:AAA family ATPase n=1 Tax=Helicobacter sp. 13S00401-1 TaxID=1905758 RepID=UPI000BA4E73C|nr:AAA family ATPase [Helicobacter sp. 13S00401-1]PAF49314.1 hypothetical protein BKH43_06955 [Helicobacter sp. 13S00401-1]
MIKKPILPNGYIINGIKINHKVPSASKKIEFYGTSDGRFLTLFLEEIFEYIELEDTFYITVGSKRYFAFISDTNYANNLAELKKRSFKDSGFASVAGMDKLKEELRKHVINVLKNKKNGERFKVSLPNGILLYGPPGCGKTFIARKLAEELGYAFIEVRHSDIASPYIHGGVGNIAAIFASARKNAPCVIFIDEIDGLGQERGKLSVDSSYKQEEINELLSHINGIGKEDILVIGATNELDKLDKALQRSGRFDIKIEVGPPDLKARMKLFEMYLKDRATSKLIIKL